MARHRKPRVHAWGRLHHKFHGTYWCAIVLCFENAEAARAALCRLHWFTVSIKHDDVLVATLTGKAIDVTVRKLERMRVGDKKERIDGMPYSIDYGPDFEIEVMVDAAPVATPAMSQ